MSKIEILILFGLFLFSICQYEGKIEEGTKTYLIEKNNKYNFTFTAVDDGTFVIIFPDDVTIYEATGDIHEDVNFTLYGSNGFYTRVFAQNFVKGNYFKFNYPHYSVAKKTSNFIIRIEKIEAYFRLMTSINPIIITMAVNDCQKPIYIFAYNNQPDYPESYYAFHAQIHSGEFSGSYRKTNFDPQYEINKDFVDFNISLLTDLPYTLSLNIIKLQCKTQGIISIYMTKLSCMDILDEIALCTYKNILTYSEQLDFKDIKLPSNAYFQGIKLYGTNLVDLRSLGDKKYYNSFLTKLYLSSSLKHFEIRVENQNVYTMMISYFNLGETNDNIAKENEEISVMNNERVIISLNEIKDKKYIKITSSIPKFYWNYHISQTSDINYLPKIDFKDGITIKNIVKGNTVYIDNPFTYQNIKTDFKWFISFIHYNNEKVTFIYKYTNEKSDENSSSSTSVFFVILFILFIVGVIFFAWFFYRKKKIGNKTNIDKLISDTPNQKLV